MKKINSDVCRIYSNLKTYKEKVKRTEENVFKMLEICKNPYIAFSCGKDSSVMADIVLKINKNITCRFVSSGETRIIHNVDSIIDYFKSKYKMPFEEINFDRVFSEEWQSATFDEQRKAGNKDIQTLDNEKYDGVFIGLRKQESRGRSITLRKCKAENLPDNMYKYKAKEFYRMCPLADWTTEDVGAYIESNGIKTLDWYNEYGYDSRTTARLTGDAVRQNTLFYIKTKNIYGYQKLIERFPELKIY